MPTTKATTDRIEGENAVLLTTAAAVRLPLALLPNNIKEGDVVNIIINLDGEKTAADKAIAKEMLNEILKNETA
ncbi:hypothetical protein A3I35_00815 [Candidatus Falkowbacteria bacterium RIFCSPLOWO2_02_FULL_45_15]|uniref:DUF3006 domain-containing protein n=2 Tax=Candidatus Falkowiibacteriota TaxID=1752728 RepID=A0A1F5RWT4_9BACT|nr:MAG: hypothetical protein A3D54_00095 [Candidatus Falkowbacteria bacterium RIFCSPHIGHO2_02_FULL_45_15]OGF20050.1 MAG: hypothetical protein A3I35_00815 [Candidatus Falkowbacteria bacterium RIFCSPLOWO2_02_FULL_45_15]